MEPTGIIGTSSGSASLDDAPQTAPSPRLRGAQVEKPWLARPGLFFGHVLLLFQGPVRFGEVGFPCGYRATVEDALWCYLFGALAYMGWSPETFSPACRGFFLSRLKLDYDADGYPKLPNCLRRR